jgi:hypothetical protein
MDERGVGLEERYIRSDRMVGRPLAEEYLLVPLVSHGAQLDSIFGLNRVGSFIWERLDGRVDGHAIVRALVDRFDVDTVRAERDYLAFLSHLKSSGAVRPAGEVPETASD